MIPIIRAPFHSPTSSLLKATEIEEVGVGGELILKKKVKRQVKLYICHFKVTWKWEGICKVTGKYGLVYKTGKKFDFHTLRTYQYQEKQYL